MHSSMHICHVAVTAIAAASDALILLLLRAHIVNIRKLHLQMNENDVSWRQKY